MKNYDERAHEILEKRDVYNRKKAKRNRLITIIAVITVMSILTASVFVIANTTNVFSFIFRKPQEQKAPAVTGHVSGTDAENPATAEPGKYNDGVIGPSKPAGEGDYYPYYDVSKGGLPSADSPMDREMAPSVGEPDYGPGYDDDPIFFNGETDPKAGTLTAGEWKDADNLPFWRSGFQKNEWNDIAKERSLYAINVVTVKVAASDGLPCFNSKVELKSGETVIYTARTDINGNAYLFYNINTDTEKPDSVTAAGKTVQLDGKKEIKIEAEATENLKQLDLLLMIDTTGSMGDELEYIKVELEDMVKRISEADESYSIRVSVNFYRDEGDDYVVKYYDFRTDIKECLEQLAYERADGGGDTPEAVHTALENAVTGHQWRDGAVKICFFVLDAPPHSENEVQGVNESLLKSIKKAAELGIRIIPVASSGVDTETEVLLRSFAVMTGGTYIFITDHSGIGFDHKEAEVGDYTVETLNECMIRVVCEYCGIYHGEKVPYTNPHPDPDTQMQ